VDAVRAAVALRAVRLVRIFRVLRLGARYKQVDVIIATIGESVDVLGILVFILGMAGVSACFAVSSAMSWSSRVSCICGSGSCTVETGS
jgi:hypothetical protein